jgi:hypothetical protein
LGVFQIFHGKGHASQRAGVSACSDLSIYVGGSGASTIFVDGHKGVDLAIGGLNALESVIDQSRCRGLSRANLGGQLRN